MIVQIMLILHQNYFLIRTLYYSTCGGREAQTLLCMKLVHQVQILSSSWRSISSHETLVCRCHYPNRARCEISVNRGIRCFINSSAVKHIFGPLGDRGHDGEIVFHQDSDYESQNEFDP